MTAKTQGWSKQLPEEPGFYWMKDDSGGPSLYVVELIAGELHQGLDGREWRLPLGSGMINSTRWKKATDEALRL